MTKVSITADIILELLKSIFNDNDIDLIQSDDSLLKNEQSVDENTNIDVIKKTKKRTAKSKAKSKKVVPISLQKLLNIEYYTFKHRPESTEQIIAQLKADGRDDDINELGGLDRAFCCYTQSAVERPFARDLDQPSVSGTLDFWVQTSKIKFIEYMIDICNRKLAGVRIPVWFGVESGSNANSSVNKLRTMPEGAILRKATIIFNSIVVSEPDPYSMIGEAVTIEVGVMVKFDPPTTTYNEYSVHFTLPDGTVTEPLPLSSFSMTNTMAHKGMPTLYNVTTVGQINLSSTKSFELTFDGYNHDFIAYLATLTLGQLDNNNVPFSMHISREMDTYTFECLVSSHSITVANNTSNEVHKLTLSTKADSIRVEPARVIERVK